VITNNKPGIYIRALIFASERDSFTIQQLSEHLQLTKKQEFRLVIQIGKQEIFYHPLNRVNYVPEYNKGREIPLSMSVEDEFRLLEYTELKEARESSNKATKLATRALIVSIIAAASSIFFSYQNSIAEMNYPTDVKDQIINISSEVTRILELSVSEKKSTNKKNQQTLKTVPADFGITPIKEPGVNIHNLMHWGCFWFDQTPSN
jgi:hypothetical protein